ncbi:FecR family protein [Pedobacter alluvionis]|uniref:FecR family protein n=1 Tax=Pedobacter alluvionis TaxID=475253 RepID=A0A497XUA4_9SPHI|nr:FecR family protein [Pedobacter alluvionis]RLJ72011.1 FecR family protein [Pedobacter alluvionis]TFB28785.1 FecR family protein [Pedobacter alluvionis]
MNEKIKVELLFEKHINNTINDEELFQLHSFFQTGNNEEQLNRLLQAHFASEVPSNILNEKSAEVADLAWIEIQHNIGLKKPTLMGRISWITKVAAAVLIFVSLSVSIYFILKNDPAGKLTSKNITDIQPGTNRASLISSKGTVYQLNGEKQEIITENGIVRYKDGTLVENEELNQNLTLSTPKGGQYCVTLSDGTKVWLNAASSLSYPATFSGKERRVELVGEAYFEVHHNASLPFIVSTMGQQIRVLGTSFNVNAYQDENKTVTTLVNGRVQLSREGNNEAPQLHPGEQSVLAGAGFEIAEVDASLFVAWKDGQFRFKATPLTEVMRQVERWYNLDVDYTGIPADIQIHASISRDKKLSTVLHALEKITDLKFDIKGRSVKLMR